MLTIYSDTHRLHHGTELKDGVLKPSVEMPHRADTVLARIRAVGLGAAAFALCRPPDPFPSGQGSAERRAHGDR
jgi:hypothetical protein